MEVMSTEEMISLLDKDLDQSSPMKSLPILKEPVDIQPKDDDDLPKAVQEATKIAKSDDESQSKKSLTLEDSSDDDLDQDKSKSAISSDDEFTSNKPFQSQVSKRKKAVLSSDDEDDESKSNSESSPIKNTCSMEINSSDDEQDLNASTDSASKIKRKKAVMASDSSDDDEEEQSGDVKSSKAASSDSDSGPEDREVHHRTHSSSEDENVARNPSSDEEDLANIKSKFYGKTKESPKRKSTTKQSRKSRDSAMKEIYSESTRMLRESKVGLPYHAPKQRTLDEFLNRHKKSINVVNDIKRLGFDEEKELEDAEKLLKQREEETEEFFAEAADDEDDGDDEDYVPEAADSTKVDDSGIMGSEESASNESAQKEIEETPTTEVQQPEVEDSMKLVLEPDTEKLVEEDVVECSQDPEAEQAITEKLTPGLKIKMSGENVANLTSLGDILNTTPKLGKNFSGQEIVFDDEVPNKGLDDLQNRFIKHIKASNTNKRRVEKTVMTIVSKQKDSLTGEESLKTEKLNYISTPSKVSFDRVLQAKKSERIGAQQIALRATLKEKIAEKRRREKQKQIEIAKEDNEDLFDGGENHAEDEDEEILDDEDITDEEESEEEEEEEEETEVKEHKRIKSCSFLDDEAEDDDVDDVLTKDEKEEIENVVNDVIDKSENLPDTEDLLKQDSDTPFPNTLAPRWTPFDERTQSEDNKTARKKLGFEGLFDTSDPKVDDMEDVVGLLSGQFATQKATQSVTETPDTVILTNNLTSADTVLLSNPPTQSLPGTEPVEKTQPGFMEEDCGFLMLQSSSDEDEDLEDKPKKKILTKKKTKRLVLSDDSDESDNEQKEKADEEGEESDAAEDEAVEEKKDEIVMYDSEENEIRMSASEYKKKFKGFKNKKGRWVFPFSPFVWQVLRAGVNLLFFFRMRGMFVENEAALSGSDDELANYSEDEDERGLDRLDVEDGDMDDLDEDELKDELERIHHREVLNQDQREIKYLQEVMLEDGDLHSDHARTRKFKWKNLDDDIELEQRHSDEEADHDEDQAELEKRRLERLDREKWLNGNYIRFSKFSSDLSLPI